MTEDRTKADDVSEGFLLQCLQEWGQSYEARVEAAQGIVDFVGYSARVTALHIVFGGIAWIVVEGAHADAARGLLLNIARDLRRGEYWDEIRQIKDMVVKARAALSTTPWGSHLWEY